MADNRRKRARTEDSANVEDGDMGSVGDGAEPNEIHGEPSVVASDAQLETISRIRGEMTAIIGQASPGTRF